MNAVIAGVGFLNKGAELMMLAVLQELRSWPENPEVALPLNAGNFGQRARTNVAHLIARKVDRAPLLEDVVMVAGNLIPSSATRHLHWMRARDVDLVLDASGYVYSDQPGMAPHRSVRLYRRLASQGTRIILLPQAFGPFDSEGSQAAFREIVTSSALVIARDEMSLEHARKAAPFAQNLQRAPDFTVSLKPVRTEAMAARYKDRACVIPNIRMLRDTTAETATWYLESLERGLVTLRSLGLSPFVLLHQETDIEVVEILAPRLPFEVEVVRETNPLILKGIIGCAQLVIGSRYHGLVSALAQAVPALGIGWSHKYRALFEDFGCPGLLVDNLQPWEDLGELVRRLAEREDQSRLVADLEQHGHVVRSAVEAMWRGVHEQAVLGQQMR